MTLEYVKSNLRKYYERKGVPAPTELAQREFGFGDIKKIDYRHISFKNPEDLKKHFIEHAPLYASFSAAYYEFPDARPMEKKNTLGSDLIFEFDAECTHSILTCEKCLEKTKQDSIKLIEEFLIPDFGFDRKEISVAFSGARGYHTYVTNEDVRFLNSKARREIVDYLQANGFEPVKKVKEGSKEYLQGPGEKSAGWSGKFYNYVMSALENSKDADELYRKGFSKNTAEKLFEDKQHAVNEIKKGNYDLMKGIQRQFGSIISGIKVDFKADIDQSVTLDVSRLIRLPGTIHGGSSLLCNYIELNKLTDFNPFKDAVVFDGAPVKIKFIADAPQFVLSEQTFGPFKKDYEETFPEYAAMLLCCKQLAKAV